jgi:hypothetical protein
VSCFHVLLARTRFRRYRGLRVPFSCFGVPRLVFGDTEVVVSLFHVLRAGTRFRRYRGSRAPFSCFARPNSFSAVPRESCPFFMFCAPELVFGGPRASCPVYMFCAPGLVFGGTEGVSSRFHVLHNRTRFRRYRGRRVPFSCFAHPDSFSAVQRASCPVFMFCAPGLVFGDIEAFVSRFHVLHARTRFCGGTEGVRSRFHILRVRTRLRRYRGGRVPFSSFARQESFSAVPRASGPVFMFCALGLIFGDTESVGSRFHVLRARTYFRRYRGRRVPFSSFACPNSFSAVPRASCPVFMFCAP